MQILVTEAYSASNIGDLELVERSIEVARRRHGTSESTVVCLAVDPESFKAANLNARFSERLFPRLQYVKASRAGRMRIALSWAVLIAALSLFSIFGRASARAGASWLLSRGLAPDAVGLYLTSSYVVAVGGGYLGDQYSKETLLTAWTWWWATTLGASVETMPLSVEVTGKPLRSALGFLTRSVEWRVRDASSAAALSGLGVGYELLPDLAFLNTGRWKVGDSLKRLGPILAPVGSDYLSEDQSKSLTTSLVGAIGSPDLPVGLLSMHRAMASTRVGGDELAVSHLAAAFRKNGVETEVLSFSTYQEVCEACARAEFVISARMHAGIAALCSGTKVGLLAYEEKHFSLMRDLGLGDYVVDIRSPASVINDLIERVRSADVSVFRAAANRYLLSLESGLALDPDRDLSK